MRECFRIPEEFVTVATLPIPELAARFGVSKSTARKWRETLGVKVRVGAPKGNSNHVRDPGDDPEKIRICLSCTAKRCTGDCIKVH